MTNLISTQNLLSNLDRITFQKNVTYFYSFEKGVIEREVLTFTKDSQHGSWLGKAVFDWFQKNIRSELFITISKDGDSFSFYNDDIIEVLTLLNSFGEI